MIRVNDLDYSYSQQDHALKGISFEVKDQEWLSILGHNGSGKSTTINSILQLLNYSSGSIKIFGHVMKPDSYEIKKDIGVIFQEVAVFQELTVYVNVKYDIAFGLENRCVPRSEMQKLIVEYATKVGMQDYLLREPQTLSGGQKQRVAIAGILALNTDVIILDINLKSNLTGLDIASQLRKAHNNSYIIFTTAHAEFVFLAYKCKTFDFLCKPVTQERLEETVLRLFDDIKNNSSEKSYIRLDNKNTIIDGNEVQYIKRDGMKIIFHTKSRDYEVYSSFAKIQSHLPKNFIRCHKSFIANVNNIEKIEPTSNLVYFKNNDTCDIGPKYKEDFMKGVCTFGYVE